MFAKYLWINFHLNHSWMSLWVDNPAMNRFSNFFCIFGHVLGSPPLETQRVTRHNSSRLKAWNWSRNECDPECVAGYTGCIFRRISNPGDNSSSNFIMPAVVTKYRQWESTGFLCARVEQGPVWSVRQCLSLSLINVSFSDFSPSHLQSLAVWLTKVKHRERAQRPGGPSLKVTQGRNDESLMAPLMHDAEV